MRLTRLRSHSQDRVVAGVLTRWKLTRVIFSKWYAEAVALWYLRALSTTPGTKAWNVAVYWRLPAVRLSPPEPLPHHTDTGVSLALFCVSGLATSIDEFACWAVSLCPREAKVRSTRARSWCLALTQPAHFHEA